MQEESLFAAALERRPGSERHDFLRVTCGTDLALLRRIEDLLAAHDRPAGLLECVRQASPDPTSAPESTNTTASKPTYLGTLVAGRYRLLERIGEGGMGEVFVAEQTQPVRRKVALKLIKAGQENANVLARFEQERQALAVMDHPNIAKVFDAGVTDKPASWKKPFRSSRSLWRKCRDANITNS